MDHIGMVERQIIRGHTHSYKHFIASYWKPTDIAMIIMKLVPPIPHKANKTCPAVNATKPGATQNTWCFVRATLRTASITGF